MLLGATTFEGLPLKTRFLSGVAKPNPKTKAESSDLIPGGGHPREEAVAVRQSPMLQPALRGRAPRTTFFGFCSVEVSW